MEKQVYVFLAEGFEEIEAITIIDILRRAAIPTRIIAVGSTESVRGAHNIEILCDRGMTIVALERAAAFVLPGGMPGTHNLKKNIGLCKTLKEAHNKGMLIGAICAAPSILGSLGILTGKKAVCYPGFEEEMTGAILVDATTVHDGNIITSIGVQSAIEFALALVQALRGEATRKEVAQMIYIK